MTAAVRLFLVERKAFNIPTIEACKRLPVIFFFFVDSVIDTACLAFFT
jgi:hypothetical protein